VSTATPSATTPDLHYGQTWPTLDVFGVLARDRRVIPVVRRLMGDAGADAVLAATVFHFGQVAVDEVKQALAATGHQVRLPRAGILEA